MKYILSVLFVFAALFAASASTAAIKDGKVFKVKATVKKVYRDDKKITLDHQEVKGYMKAMTMTFGVSDTKIFRKVVAGTTGVFTMKVTKGFPMVTGVKVTGGPAIYVCPMHPDEVSDKPGTCPECGMDLVKQK